MNGLNRWNFGKGSGLRGRLSDPFFSGTREVRICRKSRLTFRGGLDILARCISGRKRCNFRYFINLYHI